MTSRIRKLDSEIANQIAAGEVIERPANACKELVENAIDAGARRITIEIEEGGKKLIRVRDDGYGMSPGDAVLALQRHATSKLRNAEDLYAIRTLGFRGEALPSIAAVSRLEVATRESDSQAGTRVALEAGVVTDVAEVGCSPGTEIAVRNLFFNTPARFKFLKSDAAEAGRIAEIVGHLALAFPGIAFRLTHNGTEMLRVEAGGNSYNAIICVFGREMARQMLPLATAADASLGEIAVSGFAGRPQLTRSNRNAQLFFVNGRVIKSRSLQHALAAAYQGLLHGHDRFPVAVIFISMPPSSVDVNVHPTKSEVRFARDWEVHHAVRVGIRETLVAAQLAPEWGLGGVAAPAGQDVGQAPSTEAVSPAGADPAPTIIPGNGWGQRFAAPATDFRGFHQSVAPAAGASAAQMQAFRAARNGWSQLGTGGPQPLLPEMQEMRHEGRLKLRPLGQISNNAYILCEGSDGLYIVCQHRAHERILADRAIAAAEGKRVQSQRLVIPFTAEIGPRAAAAIDENGALLQDLGFEIEAFGGASVLVRAVPAPIASGDYETAFADLLDELMAGNAGLSLQERRRQLLTMLACKNAIKAGDPLQSEQITSLLNDLLELPNPSICPHGQPILIRISTLELDKKFEREYASR